MADEKIDPETMDLEQLRALANEELAGEPVEEPAVEEPVPTAPPAEEEPEEVVYRREIDLGDGSGVQVFEGDTMEELVDKLAHAQENATRKIREQAQQLKERQAAPKPPETNSDDEWLLGQQLMTKPTEAFRKMFEREVGVPLEKFKSERERVNALAAAAEEHDASIAFVQSHPDYVANEANGRRMVAYLKTYQLQGTVENMEKAFKDLSSSGLLESKPTETPAPDAAPAPARRAASGLSAKRSAPAPVQKTEPTEEDLYKMPLEELEKLASKSSL